MQNLFDPASVRAVLSANHARQKPTAALVQGVGGSNNVAVGHILLEALMDGTQLTHGIPHMNS